MKIDLKITRRDVLAGVMQFVLVVCGVALLQHSRPLVDHPALLIVCFALYAGAMNVLARVIMSLVDRARRDRATFAS
jgi:zinc transporter ZupT